MNITPLVCPFCGVEIGSEKRTLRSFSCHSCGRVLRISPLYFWLPILAAIPLTASFGYAFGIRDSALAIFTIVLLFPASIFADVVLVLCFKPRIKPGQPDNLDLNVK